MTATYPSLSAGARRGVYPMLLDSCPLVVEYPFQNPSLLLFVCPDLLYAFPIPLFCCTHCVPAIHLFAIRFPEFISFSVRNAGQPKAAPPSIPPQHPMPVQARGSNINTLHITPLTS
ncbi:hypothetical protein L228DRAFT_43552 [Xylona heveae TC161]|uniref:Uncharacterized protein n=1 Tax=Xylona heveae (strain CBS 132557 / TC161) TaxID=1328760 RepID=A0A164ZS12_XYLHT|nr:hypothetical protein L228DRAFT_43552 [Xylona heveae TC161]KZF19440.1 hypothetical protein L228DRAFT_43552 [Xylona heveae TC161]